MSSAEENSSNEDLHAYRGAIGGDAEEPSNRQLMEMIRNLNSNVDNRISTAVEKERRIRHEEQKVMREEISGLQATNDQMTDRIVQLESEGHRLATRCAQLERDLVDERQNKAAIRSELTEARRQMAEVTEERDKLRQRNADLERQLKQMNRSEITEMAGRTDRMSISVLEGDWMALVRGVPLLFDDGPGNFQRFLSNVRSDFATFIQSSQLPPATKLSVIAVAGVECPEQTCFIFSLLRYLEYQSVIRDRGRAPSRDRFLSFLRQRDTVTVQSFQLLISHPGLYVWSRPFQLTADVAVFVVCAVGALSSRVVSSGVSPLLSLSVLCSSVQFVHLGCGAGAVRVHDCLHTIMKSTDFLLYSNISMATQLIPRLCLLIPDECEMCAADKADSRSKDSMLARTRDAIRHTQVRLFKSLAFGSGRCEEAECRSIGANVAGEIVDMSRLPRSYVDGVFDLYERVLGREDEVPALKIDLNGRAVRLCGFAGFVDEVIVVYTRSESIIEWQRRAIQVYARKLCEVQVTDGDHYFKRHTEAQVSAFSTHDRLKEMWDFNDAHPNERTRFGSQFNKLDKLWNIFDSCKKSSESQQRASLIAQMDGVLSEMRDVTVPDQNVRCQWTRIDVLLRGEYSTGVRRSVAMVQDRIANGDIASTRQYIETRNSLLDVTKLLNTSLTLRSTNLSQLPQHRFFELENVDVLSLRVINTTDAAWSARDGGTFSQIRSCLADALQQVASEFSSIASKMAAGEWSGADLDCEMDKLPLRVMAEYDKKMARQSESMRAGDRTEFDWIVCDQRSVMNDRIQYRIALVRTFIQAGLTGRCLYPQGSKFDALEWAVGRYLNTADLLTFCLNHVHVNSD